MKPARFASQIRMSPGASRRAACPLRLPIGASGPRLRGASDAPNHLDARGSAAPRGNPRFRIRFVCRLVAFAAVVPAVVAMLRASPRVGCALPRGRQLGLVPTGVRSSSRNERDKAAGPPETIFMGLRRVSGSRSSTRWASTPIRAT